jgi:osmotically-inducible protein OsmY
MPTSNDQRLAYEVERAIGLLPEVNIQDLRVSVVEGRARISGVVRRLREKHAAIDAAFRVQGIEAVDEAVAVETPTPETDEHLAGALGEALAEDRALDPRRVGADPAHGQARLVGRVSTLHELHRVVETTGTVPDTVNVIDSTRMENPWGPDQIDLVNAVADALRGHPVLHLRQIRPVLEETGKVVLRGEVRSDEEREQAVVLAAGVTGVHTVREELDVVP